MDRVAAEKYAQSLIEQYKNGTDEWIEATVSETDAPELIRALKAHGCKVEYTPAKTLLRVNCAPPTFS